MNKQTRTSWLWSHECEWKRTHIFTVCLFFFIWMMLDEHGNIHRAFVEFDAFKPMPFMSRAVWQKPIDRNLLKRVEIRTRILYCIVSLNAPYSNAALTETVISLFAPTDGQIVWVIQFSTGHQSRNTQLFHQFDSSCFFVVVDFCHIWSFSDFCLCNL